MSGFYEIQLGDMLKQYTKTHGGEDRVKDILSTFSCPINTDIEQFLFKKAIPSINMGSSRTYLVFADYQEKHVLVGYYTLATKNIAVSQKKLSSTLYKKISKFGTYNALNKCYDIPAPLIAQLGKNFNYKDNKLIKGKELLKMALDRIREVQRLVGGKVVYLECEDKECLKDFYSENGFFEFDQRMLESDEKEIMTGNYLIQMLAYIGND